MVDNTRVFNCDCLPAMREYPDKYFDLAIVDPPYGIGEFQQSDGNFQKVKWNDSTPTKLYFKELYRISRNQIIWGANYYNCFPDKGGAIVWDKLNVHPQMSRVELASCSLQKRSTYYQYEWHGYIPQMQVPGGTVHPCQKPVALYKWLLKNYAKEGDKILDTHGGSMSSVIACLDMGFPITCYEIDTDYYNAGKNRITNHLNQLNAFRPAYEIEFHDSTGVSTLRNQQGSGYKEQNNGENKEPIHRIDGLFHGDTV